MNEITITFPLEKAVIYPQCAGLTRAGEISFMPGLNRLIICNLPETITEDSVRVELASGSNLDIREVYTEDKTLPAYDENLYRRTKAELEALLHRRSLLEASYKNALDEFNIFYNKGSITGTLEKQLHRPLAAENWEAFFGFLEEKLKTNRDTARDILFSWLLLQREIAAGEANLEKYTAYDQVKEHRIVALVQSPAEQQEFIRLHYLQESVQWHPAYRIRADLEQQKISITLYAMVSQDTGEDWKDIAVELSTAVPMVNCDLPPVQSRLIQERSAEISINKVTKDSREKKQDMVMDLEMDEISSGEMLAPEPKMMAKKRASLFSGFSGKMAKGSGNSLGGLASLSQVADKTRSTSASPKVPPPPSQKAKHDRNRGPGEGGEMAMPADLAKEVEKELHQGFSLSALSGVYQELYAYQNMDYNPESRLPGTKDSGINPFFAQGISPLTSLGGYDYRYKTGSRKNFIPSLGSPVQLGVDIRELPMDRVYVTVPYAEEAVFLKALFANREAAPLPAGPAQVFVENTFIGNIQFPTLGRNKGTSLSLGIDKDIKVKRTQTSKRRTTGLVARGILVDFQVEIEVVSYKPEEVVIEVFERLPVSKTVKEISVQEEMFDPAPAKITDEKIIIWRIQAESGKKQILQFRYTIKHPEDYRLELSEGGNPYREGGV